MLGKVTQGPSWGYSKVNFTRFSGKRGHFLPKVDKSGQTAPRTGTGYPHEGHFVWSDRVCLVTSLGGVPREQKMLKGHL